MRTTTRTSASLAAAVVVASCGGGGGGGTPAPTPDLPPIVARAIPDQVGKVGHLFELDVTQGGTTFADPEGKPLQYEIVLAAGFSNGLSVTGSLIHGRPFQAVSTTVTVTALDGPHRQTDTFEIVVSPNAAPVVAKANADRLTPLGTQLDVDATQGGATFSDPDGEPLRYTVTLLSDPRGLAVSGTRVMGAMNSVGLVRVAIVAVDGADVRAEDEFSIAAAAPEPGRPTLPSPPYVYNDAALPLPWLFRLSSDDAADWLPGGQLFDTQPPNNRTTDAGATLGRVLFYDKRLSLTNTHACASCHRQANGFAVPERFSVGVAGTPLKRNAMGLTNVRYNKPNAFFADLRAPGLEALATMPIEAPTELGQPLSLLVPKLAATDFYPPLFAAAFGTPEVTSDRIARALAQFLRSLISYRSKFDRAFHTMDINDPRQPELVLTPQEMRGVEIFEHLPASCIRCHVNTVHTKETATNNGLDLVPEDLGVGQGHFRSASLRNIAVTGPYMHDGRFATLREVIDHYDHGVKAGQFTTVMLLTLSLPREPIKLNLSEEDKLALEAFLRTLTDDEFLRDPRFSDPFL